MLTTNDIRAKYLAFFEQRGHTRVASDSLVPQNDPTLLFTGAGMNQFKDNFLGIKKDLKRATSSQKCLRTGDLEEVGRTAFHHSFFEMLGNFSFGDYFKKEAIHWAWEFLTAELKISKDRLRISVHESDNEAYKIWLDEIKIRPDWIYKMGDKSNFWPSNAPKDGPNGPCGPCSEIYYDQDPSQGDGGHIEDDNGRFAEIWNLVFTQFDRQEGGKLVPLAQKNIDTGMGLERLACVLQGKTTNYETDIFVPINQAIEKALQINVAAEKRRSLYAIADHLRAVFISMADGVIPSNEGRGYVIRKLIRRALWHAHELSPNHHLQAPFLYSLIPSVVSVMDTAFPELAEASSSIQAMLQGEEQRFLETLETGLQILDSRIAYLGSTKEIAGKIVFELYDTYGFPDELTKKIASKKGLSIDQKGFNDCMAEQRKRAKDATQIAASIFVTTELEKKLSALAPTAFLGYETLESAGKIMLSQIEKNKGVIVLDQTPFYAESGGQVGDQGSLKGKTFEARVIDTQKKDRHILHLIEITQGAPQVGEVLMAQVNAALRSQIMRNHTATHLLHAALRSILGPQVRQLGSLVSPGKLRFDYSFTQALSGDLIQQIEDRVNGEILKDSAVSREEKDLEEAKKDGALAFFGEKYGSRVRVVSIPGFSKEFCGGTHCSRTGQIGSFVITSDSSIASGTRRIEALTGEGALDYLRSLRSQVSQLTQTLKTTPDKLLERAVKIQDELKKLQKEQSKGGWSQAQNTGPAGEASFKSGEYSFSAVFYKDLTVDGLRKQSDDTRSKSTKTLYFLVAEKDDKIHFIVGLSHDLAKSGMDVRDLAKKIAEMIGGSCGGRPDMIQGGAPNKGQGLESLEAMSALAKDFLKTKIQ